MFDPIAALRLVALNLATIALVTLAIGATAPRWPARWLRSDRGPLRLLGWESVELYRGWGFHRLARRLPEAGSAFGGASKRVVPDRSTAAISAHLVELRRGEWVHWLSNLSLLPLLAVDPWWLWSAFALMVVAVNLAFIGILRLNRLRYRSLSERLGQSD